MSALGLERIPDEPGDDPGLPSGPSSSTLDRIRALYRQQTRRHVKNLPLPGNREMAVRYGPVEDFESSASAIRDQMLDFLIAACECILVRDGNGWEPLTHAGEPVRFDEILGEIIGVPSAQDGGTARQVVLKAFSKAPVPHAAAAVHFEQLQAWMSGEGAVDEESVLGES